MNNTLGSAALLIVYAGIGLGLLLAQCLLTL